MTGLLETLDACDQIHAIKVTDHRREAWMTKAKPGDRWGVSVVEGGTFQYGRSFEEAFRRAMDNPI